jgi:hypothetical protein
LDLILLWFRTEEYWAAAVVECLIADKSSCKLGRFAAIKSSDAESDSPHHNSDLMGAVHSSVREYIDGLLAGLHLELGDVIGSCVSLSSSRGAVSVRYDMEDRKACKAHLRLHLSDMVHTLIAIATSDARLVTEYGLSQAIKTGT